MQFPISCVYWIKIINGVRHFWIVPLYCDRASTKLPQLIVVCYYLPQTPHPKAVIQNVLICHPLSRNNFFFFKFPVPPFAGKKKIEANWKEKKKKKLNTYPSCGNHLTHARMFIVFQKCKWNFCKRSTCPLSPSFTCNHRAENKQMYSFRVGVLYLQKVLSTCMSTRMIGYIVGNTEPRHGRNFRYPSYTAYAEGLVTNMISKKATKPQNQIYFSWIWAGN